MFASRASAARADGSPGCYQLARPARRRAAPQPAVWRAQVSAETARRRQTQTARPSARRSWGVGCSSSREHETPGTGCARDSSAARGPRAAKRRRLRARHQRSATPWPLAAAAARAAPSLSTAERRRCVPASDAHDAVHTLAVQKEGTQRTKTHTYPPPRVQDRFTITRCALSVYLPCAFSFACPTPAALRHCEMCSTHMSSPPAAPRRPTRHLRHDYLLCRPRHSLLYSTTLDPSLFSLSPCAYRPTVSWQIVACLLGTPGGQHADGATL